MLVLAIPFFALQLGSSDQGSDPTGSTTRTGYDLISSHFGVGYNSAVEAVVTGPGAADKAYLQRVEQTLASVPGVDSSSLGVVPLTSDIAFVTFKTTTAPQSERTYALVRHVRSRVLPPLYQATSNHIYTYGETAINVDFAKVLSRKMPLFIAVVVGLSVILLMIAFRSVVIPLTAAVMNLLAVAGSFGLIVAIFQYGWLSDGMGAGPGAPIDAWIPVMLFAILFGLSMDYQVFLVSRMHEEWIRTGQPTGRHDRSGRDRRHHHRRSHHHDRSLPRIPAQPRSSDQDLRHWAGVRGVPRCLRAQDDARPLTDAPARPIELVLPQVAEPNHTARLGRATRRPEQAVRRHAPRVRQTVGPIARHPRVAVQPSESDTDTGIGSYSPSLNRRESQGPAAVRVGRHAGARASIRRPHDGRSP